jgi:hypothetical protein
LHDVGYLTHERYWIPKGSEAVAIVVGVAVGLEIGVDVEFVHVVDVGRGSVSSKGMKSRSLGGIETDYAHLHYVEECCRCGNGLGNNLHGAWPRQAGRPLVILGTGNAVLVEGDRHRVGELVKTTKEWVLGCRRALAIHGHRGAA